MTTLGWEPHRSQAMRWPRSGRHILAQFDDDGVVVYQAYRPSIALAAVADQRLGGGGWSPGRMSSIKPNFLWMMYRSGWASKEGQEHVLAIRIRRSGFDELLARAVHSSFVPEVYPSGERWEAELRESEVRLQWDPDHHPSGAALERRAIQIGIRGRSLARFATEWTLGIEDVSERVRAEHQRLGREGLEALDTPRERVYRPRDPITARRLGLARSYAYVGPDEIRRKTEGAPPGEPILEPDDLASYAARHGSEREGGVLRATYVVDCGHRLLLAPRRSEHVACAGGEVVLGAGELAIEDRAIVEISNQSTGYCPDPSCWSEVETALQRARIAHPPAFTFEAIFRRCPSCGERNLIKDDWFQCELCEAELPGEWNF